MSIRDVVRALKRLDDDKQVNRVIASAMAYLKSAKRVNVVMTIANGSGIAWEP